MSLTILEEAALVADDDCLSWHKHCNAECCSLFTLPDLGQSFERTEIQHKTVLDRDSARYYELHGCKYAHGILFIPSKYCTRSGGIITVQYRCRNLTEDLKCKDHGTLKQPRICREFTMQNLKARVGRQSAMITKNCLYAHKLKLQQEARVQ